MDQLTIGVPRALLYHKHHELWSAFLEGIGCRVVVSPASNRRILARGVELAVDESCLPLKLLLGHIDALRGKCDAVFVPRMETAIKGEHLCVKYMGCYDIVRNTMPDLELLTYDVDVANKVSQRAEMLALAKRLGASPLAARRAYKRGLEAQRAHEEARVREQREAAPPDPGTPRILVVGHGYNLSDALIGGPILDFLRSQDVHVVLSDGVDHAEARARAHELSPSIRWTYNKELLGAIQMHRGCVDGVLFIVTFPCGPDSLMAEMCTRVLGDLPLATLVIDELSGESGLRTRLESFVDILKMRKAS